MTMITAVDTSILLKVFVDADDADQSEAGCVAAKIKSFESNIETKDRHPSLLCRRGTLG